SSSEASQFSLRTRGFIKSLNIPSETRAKFYAEEKKILEHLQEFSAELRDESELIQKMRLEQAMLFAWGKTPLSTAQNSEEIYELIAQPENPIRDHRLMAKFYLRG